VFDAVLRTIQEKVRARQFVVTLHAEDEMYEDALAIADIERALLTGRITERQKDQRTAESKYVVTGESLGGDEIEVVCKIGPTDKVVVITVYLA
jgi:hypothetical protein